MSRELPILFSTDMVQALLNGRKTQTRRLVKPQPEDGLHNHTRFPMSLDSDMDGWWGTVDATGEMENFTCPYGKPGDILYVRESWRALACDADMQYLQIGYATSEQTLWVKDIDTDIFLKLCEQTQDDLAKAGLAPDPITNKYDKPINPELVRLRPSIHMLKAAARIWLEVEDVHVERLNDISPYEAVEEGIDYWNVDYVSEPGTVRADYKNYMWRDNPDYELYHFPSFTNPCSSFISLFEKIHGSDVVGANPWVWVMKFKVLSTNGKPTN